MKDIYNKLTISKIFAPVAVTAHTTNQDLDLQGFNSALIVCVTGAGTIDDSANYFEFRVSHADDDGTGSAGAYALCEDKDLLGAGTVTAGIPATPKVVAQGAQYQIGYVGGKRFLKVELRETGTCDIIVGAYLVKSHGHNVPAV